MQCQRLFSWKNVVNLSYSGFVQKMVQVENNISQNDVQIDKSIVVVQAIKCRLLCLLPVTLKVIVANSVDPDQTAPLGAV